MTLTEEEARHWKEAREIAGRYPFLPDEVYAVGRQLGWDWQQTEAVLTLSIGLGQPLSNTLNRYRDALSRLP